MADNQCRRSSGATQNRAKLRVGRDQLRVMLGLSPLAHWTLWLSKKSLSVGSKVGTRMQVAPAARVVLLFSQSLYVYKFNVYSLFFCIILQQYLAPLFVLRFHI